MPPQPRNPRDRPGTAAACFFVLGSIPPDLGGHGQRGGELLRGLVALIRILRERAENNRFDRCWNPRSRNQYMRRKRWRTDMRVENSKIFADEWNPSGQEFVEDHTYRVEIRPLIERELLYLLWRNVSKGSCVTGEETIGDRDVDDPQIGESQLLEPIAAPNQTIFGSDVSVQCTPTMQSTDTTENLRGQISCAKPRKLAAKDNLAKADTGDERHDQVHPPLAPWHHLLPKIEDGHDMRVIEFRPELGGLENSPTLVARAQTL